MGYEDWVSRVECRGGYDESESLRPPVRILRSMRNPDLLPSIESSDTRHEGKAMNYVRVVGPFPMKPET